MARGIQPSLQQLAEERRMTLQSATGELLAWDVHENQLLDYLGTAVAHDPKLNAIVQRLKRGNRIEDSDHLELYDAVREVSA